jgi:hypothetical protein
MHRSKLARAMVLHGIKNVLDVRYTDLFGWFRRCHVTNGTNLPRPYQRNTINHDGLCELEAAAART